MDYASALVLYGEDSTDVFPFLSRGCAEGSRYAGRCRDMCGDPCKDQDAIVFFHLYTHPYG